jgi:uncharacterized DUF497 family protein
VCPNFEWDGAKANSNLAKHGVSFDEAETVADDPWVIVRLDETHSTSEGRWRALGWSSAGRLLVVIFTERPDRLRLISARRATRREQREYEER